MEITVKTDRLKNSSANISGLGKALRSYSDTVREISRSPHLDSTSREQLSAALRKISDSILEEAATADTFSKAINLIALRYEEAEKTLKGAAAITSAGVGKALAEAAAAVAAANMITGSIVQAIRNWLVEHGYIPAQKQTRTEGVPVTKHQEREMDLYMQQEIEKLKDKDPRFTEEHWRKASAEEKKQILQDYIKEISRIMGLPEVGIDWSNSPPEGKYITMGYFSRKDNSIHINQYLINNYSSDNSYRLFSTVTHEMRHYYQHEAIKNPDKYVVTTDTINSWDESFRNYRSQEDYMRDFNMTAEEAHQAYRNQAVEVDARRFAKQS